MGSGWQPISTAPKDGDVVEIVQWPEPGIEDRCLALWDDERECWIAADGSGDLYRPDGWRPLGGGS